MNAEFAELRRLAEAATPGPWEWDDDHARPGLRHGRSFGGVLFRCGALYGPAAADAAFIAAANPAVVLALHDAAAERDALADELSDLREYVATIDQRRDELAAERDALAAKVARVRDWLDHRGVDASDRDGAYMDGYRAAQRHAVIDAAELRAALDEEAQP